MSRPSRSEFTVGLSGDMCNIQHAGYDCWGVKDELGGIVNCIDNQWKLAFPGQSVADSNTRACAQGCTSFCDSSTLGVAAAAIGTSSTSAGPVFSGVGAACVLGFGALAARKRSLKAAAAHADSKAMGTELQGANIANIA